MGEVEAAYDGVRDCTSYATQLQPQNRQFSSEHSDLGVPKAGVLSSESMLHMNF